jgi:hypothetical protein
VLCPVRLIRRAYPGHYLLVVDARHTGKVLDFDRVIEEVKKMRSPFLEIWVVAFIGLNHLKVVRVAPGGPAIDLKLRADLEKARKQRSFLKRRIRGNSGSSGQRFCPFPEVTNGPRHAVLPLALNVSA